MQCACIEFKSDMCVVHLERDRRGTSGCGQIAICRGELVDCADGLSRRRFVDLLPTNSFEMSFALAVVAGLLAKLAIRADMLR